MGFLSFNLRYYAARIERYERGTPSASELLEAKRLLKMLDDLVDEGYTALYRQVESEFQGVSRLRALIAANAQTPFRVAHTQHAPDAYGAPQAMTRYLERLMRAANARGAAYAHPFLEDLAKFCDWIGYDAETAYVFLLRDALMPYCVFQNRGGRNLYPWLIGRAFVNALSPGESVDDRIRAVLFDALASGRDTPVSFFRYCRAGIREAIAPFPAVVRAVCALLSGVTAQKILVVESGCYGTFPMLLYALDERVDFRMFTTTPYLHAVYAERIYTSAYEKNRLFETLSCQDRLFRFADFRNNQFYISENTDAAVRRDALCELRAMIARAGANTTGNEAID